MMKKIISLLSFCLLWHVTIAQNATVMVRFKGLESSTVEVTLPVNETNFFLNKKTYTIGTDSSITINMQLQKAVLIRCEGYGLIIEPGNTSVTIDKSKNSSEALHYNGKSQPGHLLFQKWQPEFYQYLARKYHKKDSTADGARKLIKADEVKALLPYDNLLKAGEITPLFYQFVKADIQTYYASVMAHIPLSLYYDAKRTNKRPFLSVEYEKLLEEVYKEYPVKNPSALTSYNYYNYAFDYCIYKSKYLTEKNQKKNKASDTGTEAEYFRFHYNNLGKQFKGSFKEYMLAYFVGYEMIQDRYQPVLTELFTRFTKAYPKSNYTAGLQPMVDKIAAFNAQAAKALTPEQVLVDNYENINSLEELLNLYKDKLLYIDIWATWCGPCKREFAYNKELKQHLKTDGIEILYISMDEASAEEQWKTMIKFYDLTGNHLRTSDSLKQDLINKLWNGEGYAIPRYLIVKEGKVINNDALRPSDKEKLYKLLKSSM